MYDILYEIPIRNSSKKLYFLLEHKSRRAIDFQIQMIKYKHAIHKSQKKEFGKMSSIIPVLFYQGLDNWDPLSELDEIKNLTNPIVTGNREESKKVDLEEEMLDYIFRSRLESRELVEETIMGKQKTLTLYERALEEGVEKGEFKNKLETARKMWDERDSLKKILRITGLSEDQLKENGIL